MDVSPKLVLRSLVQVQPTYFHLIHDISCHFEYIQHSLKYSKTLVLHSFSLISDRRYQITLFIVMMLVFTIPDFATFKEEKVKSGCNNKNDRPGDDGTLRSVKLLVFLLGVIDLASA